MHHQVLPLYKKGNFETKHRRFHFELVTSFSRGHVAHSYAHSSNLYELLRGSYFGVFWAVCSIPRTRCNWEQNLTVLKAPTVGLTHGTYQQWRRTHQRKGEQSIHLSILGLPCQMKSKFEGGSELVTQSRAFSLIYIKPKQENSSVFNWYFAY